MGLFFEKGKYNKIGYGFWLKKQALIFSLASEKI
jgi:hypothetical protein